MDRMRPNGIRLTTRFIGIARRPESDIPRETRSFFPPYPPRGREKESLPLLGWGAIEACG